MERIRVAGVDPSIHIDLERIVGLFFPGCKVIGEQHSEDEKTCKGGTNVDETNADGSNVGGTNAEASLVFEFDQQGQTSDHPDHIVGQGSDCQDRQDTGDHTDHTDGHKGDRVGTSIAVTALLHDLTSGKRWQATDTTNIRTTPNTRHVTDRKSTANALEGTISTRPSDQTKVREQRKRVKQAISRALLKVLEQATDVVQPWGVLTGVRPTKLLHAMLRQGHSFAEARDTLQRQFLLQPVKCALLEEIVTRQRAIVPDLYTLDREVSLYIGIPFCPTKCAYCTFPAYAIKGQSGSVEDFLAGLHEEIRAVGAWLKAHDIAVTTVYFGGGTPTSITAEQLEALFAELHHSLHGFDRVREWTVEAGRPDTIDEEKLGVLKKWHVDRISINPQSFKEETLQAIGRHHSVAETVEKYALAREMGMQNINMDLIIGLPGERRETFRQSLRVIAQLRPESLTVHTLSFKRGSRMTQNKRKYEVASAEEVAEMVEMAQKRTKEMGYVPYYLYRQKNILGNQENVGYAFPGQESLYNIMIMEERQTIIGLGCGAVSKIVPPGTAKIIRWPNPKEPRAYIKTYREMIPEKLAALTQAFEGS
ncbi:coproporphyrinogen III oxidase [Numidum massiliense]|uniref:coproporphyrinogen III oxidase n=1 Tax=Numidum massiliense TaxID=1522315 RepID=UPI0006D532CF|nr:coproporphyrinogen III oxidase [Numidum massiliense]